jgi:hypothetical protein
MSSTYRLTILIAAVVVAPAVAAHGQGEAAAPAPADRAVYLDQHGVVRWREAPSAGNPEGEDRSRAVLRARPEEGGRKARLIR